ncbi:putative disulfide formation protein C [Paenibacillus sp. J31TS4]|uniref:disulfide oxidoreductase n=1 Tax=Paenibacillus sp. J31TS4 TaxID=2807195 RepID=UPI001B142E00|nr:disulfide oxidoreductase [Paenibacillus sp. J31TS4]GIP38094.1 putative disulfide formation protein C [Paenibacillus sp. J31TS4]
MAWKKFILANALQLSFAVALVATLGSLYLSEVLRFEPCKLCWLQRIFMYPLVVLLAVATFRKDNKVYLYVLPLAGIGGLISLYHYMIQKVPYFHENASACGDASCAYDYLDYFGIITIPLLALTAFILIGLLQWQLARAVKE